MCLTSTVEPPITDTPNSGHPPNNGRQLMYQLLFPLTQYIYSSEFRSLAHFVPPITDKGRGFVGGVGIIASVPYRKSIVYVRAPSFLLIIT